MKSLLPALLVLVCAAGANGALRDRFPELVRADPPVAHGARPNSGVRITYLGTNGYLLEAHDAVVLVDPYFSRMSLWRSGLRMRTRAEPERVDRWLAGVPRIDGILVTHGHIDHLFDVPQILKRRPKAQLYAAGMSIFLARGAGAAPRQLHAVRPGGVVNIGGATVRVLRASHDRVFGRVPFEGTPRHYPPTHVNDWTCGETLAYLIEIGGKRIYLAAGSLARDRPDAGLGRIDLAIQGAATPDALAAWPGILRRLKPARVLPTHMDDFFRPLDRGFSFLAFTDFPRVRQLAAGQGSELILLDYFQPWTLR
jgi:L-ascorbate metabolism protein UlaG (beta-lactamase superfamily)